MVNLEICSESCNTLDDTSCQICISSTTQDVNLGVFYLITEINESKTLKKHTSCERKRKLDGRKCNSDQNWDKIIVDASTKI